MRALSGSVVDLGEDLAGWGLDLTVWLSLLVELEETLDRLVELFVKGLLLLLTVVLRGSLDVRRGKWWLFKKRLDSIR